MSRDVTSSLGCLTNPEAGSAAERLQAAGVKLCGGVVGENAFWEL